MSDSIGVEEAKKEILLALYRLTKTTEGLMFAPRTIRDESKLAISISFAQRILSYLVENKFAYDDSSLFKGPSSFRISDSGISRAEKIIAARAERDQLEESLAAWADVTTKRFITLLLKKSKNFRVSKKQIINDSNASEEVSSMISALFDEMVKLGYLNDQNFGMYLISEKARTLGESVIFNRE